MPTFDFRCDKCQMTQERLVHSQSAPAPTCKKCGGETHKQVCTPSNQGFKCDEYKQK